MSWRRIAVAWGGPLLIVALVSFALRGFVFDDRLTNEHPDLLAFWLPRWAFLGRSLRELQIPMWNPFEMQGYRFAADPQSGWLYAAPSTLFTLLSPGTAMRIMVVLNPMLAGLGAYAFLRVDGLGRIAATTGGVSLAGVMAASEIALAMPFAGAIAWTTVLLVGAAGFLRATRWSRRIAWMALAGFAWSQVAGAHLSHGLAVATALTVAYVIARSWGGGRAAAGRAALLLAIVPLCALAVLVPRLRFIDASSLGNGYDRLGVEVHDVARDEEEPIQPGGVWAGWPLAFGAAPGAYAGAVALLAAPLALRARRRRRLVVAFAGVLGATWILLLPLVLGTAWIRDLLLRIPYGDVVLHNPGRLRYVAVIALPVLAAAGIQGLRDEPLPVQRLALWLAAGALLWLGIPIVAGGNLTLWIVFAVALIPAVVALWLSTRTTQWGVIAVGVLTVELAAGALLAGRVTGDELRTGLEGDAGVPPTFQPLRWPDADLDTFLTPTPFVELIGDDRYLTWVPPAAAYEKGYLFAQEPVDWPALANERGTLFGIRDSLGYNPVQLPRYWAWMRAANPLPLAYNAAALARPTPNDLEQLGVRFLVVPQGVPPPVPGTVVATADGYDLVDVAAGREAAPAVVRSSWVEVASTTEALELVTSPTWTPSQVVLESDPGLGAVATPPRTGTVDVTSSSATRLAMTVETGSPSIVVVRTAYDPGWTATVDGTPVDVLPADGFLMGIPVTDGEHAIALTYRDGDILLGLLLSTIVWLGLLAGFVAASIKERRLQPTQELPLDPDAASRRPSPGRTAARRGAAGSGTPS